MSRCPYAKECEVNLDGALSVVGSLVEVREIRLIYRDHTMPYPVGSLGCYLGLTVLLHIIEAFLQISYTPYTEAIITVC
jgi:hypothetical protein